MKENWKKFELCSLIICVLLFGCQPEPPPPEAALFSWKAGAVAEGDFVFQTMAERELGVLYQNFTKELDQASVDAFFTNAAERGIAVYLLTGDPAWALQEDGDSLCAEVERAAELNRSLPEGKLQGILIDVEPYLLDEWEEGAQEVMESFTKGMKAAYALSREHRLEVIICIPYFYDSEGFGDALETLIGFCCDQVAVMNYYREKEIAHIETEAALAKKYNKGLISIYELKAPGSHGLTEKNTYYREGLNSVNENFRRLKEAYPDQTVSMALHDLEALKEVLRRE